MGKTLDTMTLAELWKDHAAELAAADAVYADLPKDGDPPVALLEKAAEHNQAVHTLELEIKARQDRAATASTLRAEYEERKRYQQTPVLPAPFGGRPDATGKAAGPQTPMDRMFADPEFKGWHERMTRGGRTQPTQFNMSPAATLDLGFKDLITGASDSSGGAFVTPDYRPFIATPYQPTVMRDVITTTTTASDTVSYPREVSRTSAAAIVAEATDVGDATGGKPQSSFVLERVDTTVKTIAHWVAITRQALADAGQLRPYIDQFLMKGLELKWEAQVLTGDGSNGSITGILNTSGISTQAWVTDILVTTRKARTTARVTALANPTAYVLNPADWETIDLSADNEHRYYYGGPAVLGTPRLWGLPVIESQFITAGVGLTGDFATVVWYDRQITQLFMSDSHSDFFTRNLIAILAEMRGALALLRPAAMVSIDLTA